MPQASGQPFGRPALLLHARRRCPLQALLEGLDRGEDLAEHSGEGCLVEAVVLVVEARGDELLVDRLGVPRSEPGDVQVPAGLLCQLVEEDDLGAGVALAEGVDDVHAPPEECELRGELAAILDAPQLVVGLQLPGDLAPERLDLLVGHVAVVLLGHVDGAHFAGPDVDVLEDLTVDRAHVVEREVAVDRLCFSPAMRKALRRSSRRRSSALSVQPYGSCACPTLFRSTSSSSPG